MEYTANITDKHSKTKIDETDTNDADTSPLTNALNEAKRGK